MHLLQPTGARAAFLRVFTTVHLALAVVITAGTLWVEPASVSEWFNTFPGSGFTLGQRALLFMSMGCGGLHVGVAFSAGLILIALAAKRSPSLRTALIGL
ncbi:MAG: hypothetical protein MUE97_07810 [Phycisphaerales bacterium]|jgi:hypothetical protein|nr:hypothetical protein [Phycisphaerales bacterium]